MDWDAVDGRMRTTMIIEAGDILSAILKFRKFVDALKRQVKMTLIGQLAQLDFRRWSNLSPDALIFGRFGCGNAHESNLYPGLIVS